MIIRTMSTLSLIALLSSCGLTPIQKQQIAQFATATESVSTSTQAQFKATREKVIEIERRRLIMRNITPPKDLDLDGGLSASGIAIQIMTLKALGAYGNVLNKLASNDQSEAITKATTEFLTQYEAAIKIQDNAYSLNKEKKDLFLKIVGIAGAWFVEQEKKKYMKSLVSIYAPEISKLAALLKNDLTLKEDSLCIEKQERKLSTTIKVGVIDHYCTSAKSLINISSSVLNIKDKEISFQEREFAYNSYGLALAAVEEIRLMSTKGAKAVEGLIMANNKVNKVISDDGYTTDDIKAFAQQVEELQTLVSILTDK